MTAVKANWHIVVGVALMALTLWTPRDGDMLIMGGLVALDYFRRRDFAKHHQPSDDAYKAGYSAGYDEGWHDGRSHGRPVVVPIKTGTDS